jgi:hypothetical protein
LLKFPAIELFAPFFLQSAEKQLEQGHLQVALDHFLSAVSAPQKHIQEDKMPETRITQTYG